MIVSSLIEAWNGEVQGLITGIPEDDLWPMTYPEHISAEVADVRHFECYLATFVLYATSWLDLVRLGATGVTRHSHDDDLFEERNIWSLG